MLAPIVLFVYNRPEQTRLTLEALKNNSLAAESLLFIFCDGPKKNASHEDTDRIKQVRAIVRSQSWCKTVKVSEFDANNGLANSVIYGVSELLNTFGKVIVLEDDIVTSPDFLNYMNAALDYYNGCESVAGISGYTYPNSVRADSIYFLPIGCSWGWATWRRVWDQISFDGHFLLHQIRNAKLVSRFDFGNYPFFSLLTQQVEGSVDSWAIRFYASFFLKEMCFVYPPESLVQNIGYDATATHTRGFDPFFGSVTAANLTGQFRDPIYDRMTEGVKSEFQKTFKQNRESMPLKFFGTLRNLRVAIKNKIKRLLR